MGVKNGNYIIKRDIELNNAKTVLENAKANKNNFDGKFLTIVQGNSFSGVNITDSNIKNNSRFIIDLWD